MRRLTGFLLAGVVVVVAILLGASIVPAQRGPTLEPNERVAVGVNVRAQPSSDATIRAVLRPRDRATQIGEVANWYNVRLSDGTEGGPPKRSSAWWRRARRPPRPLLPPAPQPFACTSSTSARAPPLCSSSRA